MVRCVVMVCLWLSNRPRMVIFVFVVILIIKVINTHLVFIIVIILTYIRVVFVLWLEVRIKTWVEVSHISVMKRCFIMGMLVQDVFSRVTLMSIVAILKEILEILNLLVVIS